MRLERWRASVLMRVTTWVLFGVFVVLAVAVQFDGPWEPSVLLLAVGLVALGAFFPYLASGYIDLFEDVVVIDGWWRRRREVPLAEIVAVEPDRYGLDFRTGPHEVVSGPSAIGQKGWVADLLKVQTRGDRIAARVMSAAVSAREDSRRHSQGR